MRKNRSVTNQEVLDKLKVKEEFYDIQNQQQRSKELEERLYDPYQRFLNQLQDKCFINVSLQQYKNDLIELPTQRLTDLNYKKINELRLKSKKKLKTNRRQKKNWSKDDFIIMLWVIEKYNALHDKVVEEYVQEDWLKISSLVPGKDHHQCMFKWLGLKRNKYTEKYPWTETEESLLKVLVQESNPNHWFEVSKELYLQNTGFKVYRSPKQCRQRWACYLNPKLKKGPWCPEQDMILLGKYLEIGKKWSNIAKLLNGRTENAVKNRFNLILEKKQKLKSKMSDQDFIRDHLQNIQINMFMKLPFQQSLTSSFNLDKQIQFYQENIMNQQELQNQLVDITAISEMTQSSHTLIQQREITKFVSIQSIKKLKALINQNIIDIYPCTYDQQKGQIEYKPILPISKKDIIEHPTNILFLDLYEHDIESENLTNQQADILSRYQKYYDDYLF